jgi:serine/threonine protein kinase
MPQKIKEDSWTLGIILYQLCTLEFPFKGSNSKVLYKSITSKNFIAIKNRSPEIINLVAVLLKKDPFERLSIYQLFKDFPILLESSINFIA